MREPRRLEQMISDRRKAKASCLEARPRQKLLFGGTTYDYRDSQF